MQPLTEATSEFKAAPQGAAAGAPSSTGPVSAVHASSRAAWIGLGALGLLTLIIFWGFEALPFMDLPAHAGLIAMRHRFPDSAFEQQHYVLAPHIGPYSVFRFLGETFVGWLGPIGAVRLLATLPALATPFALLHARRRLHDDRSTLFGYLGVALSFGFMTLMGFASYLLGVAVMIVGLTMWLELMAAVDASSKTARRRELLMAAFAIVMFVAHGHAFLIFLLCAGIAAVCTGERRARLLRLRSLVPALGVAAWVAWLERGSTTPPGSVPVVPKLVPLFRDPSKKVELLATPTLMTRTGIDLSISIALWILAVVCAIAMVRSFETSERRRDLPVVQLRHSRALLASAGAVTLLFLALPHAVGWFGFVDGRLLPVILILVLLAVRRETLSRSIASIMDVGLPAMAVAIVTTSLVASFFFQREATGYREVFARVPANSKLLNLPLDPNSDVFTAHPFIHYDKLILADRPVVVSDVWFHQGSALYPTPANPALRLPASYSESDLEKIDWPAYHLEDWDYVLIRTRVNAPEPYTPPTLTLDAHAGGWWLYKHLAADARR